MIIVASGFLMKCLHLKTLNKFLSTLQLKVKRNFQIYAKSEKSLSNKVTASKWQSPTSKSKQKMSSSQKLYKLMDFVIS